MANGGPILERPFGFFLLGFFILFYFMPSFSRMVVSSSS
jgi:hypothetical protein